MSRLGDVFGPTVNIAARLTSVARPGTVVVDRGLHDALSPPEEDSESPSSDDLPGAADAPDDPAADEPDTDAPSYRLKRLRRVSVKGYARLEAWRLRRPKQD